MKSKGELLEDKALQAKKAKVGVYTSQPERFTVLSIDLEMREKHGISVMSYRAGVWRCTCEFFQEQILCSHVMAAKQVLKISLQGGNTG